MIRVFIGFRAFGMCLAFGGCVNSAEQSESAAPSGMLVAGLGVETPADLPQCTPSLRGTTATLSSPAGLWSCADGMWLPTQCDDRLAGTVAYASSNKTLLACVSGEWNLVAIPNTPRQAPQVPVAISGSRALIAQFLERSGVNCANGGTKIDSGVDRNLDAVLEGAEISSTSYVCNRAPGADGTPGNVLDVADEPAGGNCHNGGARIATGSDANGNQTLDWNEVIDAVYVCDGLETPNHTEAT